MMPLFLFGGSLTTTVRSALKYVMMKRLPSSSGTPVLLNFFAWMGACPDVVVLALVK